MSAIQKMAESKLVQNCKASWHKSSAIRTTKNVNIATSNNKCLIRARAQRIDPRYWQESSILFTPCVDIDNIDGTLINSENYFPCPKPTPTPSSAPLKRFDTPEMATAAIFGLVFSAIFWLCLLSTGYRATKKLCCSQRKPRNLLFMRQMKDKALPSAIDNAHLNP